MPYFYLLDRLPIEMYGFYVLLNELNRKFECYTVSDTQEPLLDTHRNYTFIWMEVSGDTYMLIIAGNWSDPAVSIYYFPGLITVPVIV